MVAVLAALYIQRHFDIDAIRVPFVGDVTIGPALYVTFAAFAIVASSNGVNITDGLDGLAGGTLAFAFVAYMIIALLNVPHQPNLALLCAIIIGATMGFLWFNVHPAQVIMGDSGSLGLGAALAVTALITGQIVVLPLIGLVFVLETGSVILQVAYFKATGGQADLPDVADPPSLRAARLGRGEDHGPVLDRGGPRRPARRDPVHGLDQLAGMTTMTPTPTPILRAHARSRRASTLDAVRAGALAGRPVTVLGFARSGIALARFFVDAGARRDRLRRPAGRASSPTRSDRLEGRPVRLLAGPAVDPAEAWRGAALVATSPSVTRRLSRRPSRASAPR